MGISFTKMHGAGNDFLLFTKEMLNDRDYSDVAKTMCDRHFGVGADGIMVVEESNKYDVRMVYYNSDGSIGEMCGNGIRCFARYIYDNNIVRMNSIRVDTLAGLKIVNLKLDDNKEIISIKVNMGTPVLKPGDIPVISDKEIIRNEKMIVRDREFSYSALLVGVPHLIIFDNEISEEDILTYGPIIEQDSIFPNKINVNFTKIVDNKNLVVDTWERGAGRTLACGTGVCSAVFTAHKLGLVENVVDVQVTGGNLRIYIEDDDTIFMEGPAAHICKGEFII